jgi:Zn-finger nucleic acid-binding protein
LPNSPLARACPRCGSPLKTATLYGMRAVTCARCDVVIVTRRDLDQLAGRDVTEEAATEEAPRYGSTSGRPLAERDLWATFESAPEPQAQGSALRSMILTAAVVSILLGALLPAAFFLGSQWSGRPAASDDAVIAATVTAPPTPPPATEPAAVAAPAVSPEPAPAEAPPPEAPKGPSAKQLIARGWEQVDKGDASAAEGSFRLALDKKPGDVEATYGVGYALVRQQRVQDGRTYLCQALRMGPGTELQREITGLLEANRQTCE